MSNHKVTFGPCHQKPFNRVFVFNHKTIEGAREFAEKIDRDNKKIAESKRVLGPLLSIEPTEEKATSDTAMFLLGREMHTAEFGW